jgi:hypothetical protein
MGILEHYGEFADYTTYKTSLVEAAGEIEEVVEEVGLIAFEM